ncbi:YbaK/EbsC family protein [Cucumibacter marinus]|uniref:YbaK/EbsC family protein n=1 Tax=Cucumibacter marinus TaxID=1121252 RepID=UPI000422FCF1|nr:YbaK/EbsC family protein [Cucumibacter marinus]
MSEIDFTESEKRVQTALDHAGLETRIRVLDGSAHTAQMAADILGVDVAQIVKSLIFRGVESGQAYLLLVSGANRVHEKRSGRQIGEKLGRADADFVKTHTGFSIGGVSPVGHVGEVDVYMDETLFDLGEVWAAAGHPRSVFPTTAETLSQLTGARRIDVT